MGGRGVCGGDASVIEEPFGLRGQDRRPLPARSRLVVTRSQAPPIEALQEHTFMAWRDTNARRASSDLWRLP
jgi:hypothetical protein